MVTGFEIAVTCLALNVFKEARGEPIQGQHAVALVTLNRVYRAGMSKDICQVVFERGQFSWTITDAKDGVLRAHARPDRTSVEWKRAEQSARDALYMEDFTCGATYYHEARAKPYWIKSVERTGQYGNHIFYRSKDEHQHSTEGAGRGTRDTACLRANRSKGNGTGRVPATGETHHSTEPESVRSWWQRLVKYLRDVY